ncbi:MAG: DegT/DnrJ/EryC1/StrS aminotransferase family protein [Candidatus Korobacteraceae bacterium]
MSRVPVSVDVRTTSKLAVDGGTPVRSTPFPPWPYLESEEIEAAERVLRSGKINYWTGEEGHQFEKEYAEYVGTKHAVAVANGTVGLELALVALGIGPGDEVITTSRTFIASASCVVMRGAKPVIADVDRDSQNVTVDTIRQAITPRTKAIIAVHLAGWPCDMDPILELAHEHGLKVIEDCAQANGAQYRVRPVGSMGDINSFSFCQDKIITTGGEGGLVTTNSDELWERAWSFKDHGKSYDAVYRRQHGPGYRWLHEQFGTNWRLTEMQSAIGRVWLRKLDKQVAIRRRHAERLTTAFAEIGALRTTVPPGDIYHSYYKYYVFLRPERLAPGWDRDRILGAVAAEGVPCFSGSCSEIYLEKAFDGIRPDNRLPAARELGETSLMFLVHPTLSDTDMDDTIAAVKKVMDAATA